MVEFIGHQKASSHGIHAAMVAGLLLNTLISIFVLN